MRADLNLLKGVFCFWCLVCSIIETEGQKGEKRSWRKGNGQKTKGKEQWTEEVSFDGREEEEEWGLGGAWRELLHTLLQLLTPAAARLFTAIGQDSLCCSLTRTTVPTLNIRKPKQQLGERDSLWMKCFSPSLYSHSLTLSFPAYVYPVSLLPCIWIQFAVSNRRERIDKIFRKSSPFYCIC